MATSEAGAPVPEATTKVLFRRMINMGRDAVVCMKIMAFWMWLETHEDFKDIITKISSSDDGLLNLIISEAEAALASLQDYASMHVTQNLAQSVVSLSILLADKEKALFGIMDIYKRVCCVLFQDILKESHIKIGLEKSLGKMAIVDIFNLPLDIVGSSEQKKVLDGADHYSSSPSKLNPLAREWNPLDNRAPEEERCLFFTFSKGYPLDEREIFQFFTKEYGDECVESIYVHWPDPQKVVQSADQQADQRLSPNEQWLQGPDEEQVTDSWPPMLLPQFGKVIFKTSSTPAIILKGKHETKFVVNGKPLWCKKFVPKKLRLK